MRLSRADARRSIAVFMMAAVISATACGGDDPVAPPALAGRWALASVDGAGLPVILASGMTTTYITSGLLDFRSRGRVLDIQSYRRVAPLGTTEVGPDTVAVAYELSGNRLILKRTYLGGRTFSDTGEVDLDVGGMLIRARDIGPIQDLNRTLLYLRL